jgi:di/tricarboxylate transporter
MPLHNAATLGGTVTLLGTSTNMVVSGLVEQSGITDKNGDQIILPLFKITKICLIYLSAGVVHMILFAWLLLTDMSASGVSATIKNPREYTVQLLNTRKLPIVGETVTSAGLRKLQGLFLVEITRDDGTAIPAVSPDTTIMADDVLLLAGVVETVTELYHIPCQGEDC